MQSHVCAGPAIYGEPRGTLLPSADSDRLFAQACKRVDDHNLAGAAAIVDRLLAAGRCDVSLALLSARLAEDLADREGEALGAVLGVLGSHAPHPPQTASSLHFAAARLHEQMGRYDEAFGHATRANAPWANAFNVASWERLIAACIANFSPAALRNVKRATIPDPTPVFIVGMPRSGSTLVEQVLASHPQVFGGGELPWVYRLWRRLYSRIGMFHVSEHEALARMSSQDADAVAAEYLGPLRALQPHAARIVDKNLSNFLHLGLIWALFPGARVIVCRRDPLDTCVSCYMTEFETVLPFTCSLPAIGHFYRQYERLMSHWRQVLDLPILEIEYEAMVRDLEGHARRLIGFLGLPWDERCLLFHRNRRRVDTASRAQVRRPIYTSSVERWRRYERWLGPLRESLGR
ncbi:MAG TPA: sulfotransferase [Tepidisphaeraceae bacterium]